MAGRPDVLDPFQDFETEGYLRNRFRIRDADRIRKMELAAFDEQVFTVLNYLRSLKQVRYHDLLAIHRMIFLAVYPWAGNDRLITAPDIAIGKAGYADLFAHPRDCERAADHALRLGQDTDYLLKRPGEVFGLLAYAHPFLEGNGRTILTVHTELCRRAGFHIRWSDMDKIAFLEALTRELQSPGEPMDRYLRPYVQPGSLTLEQTSVQLSFHFSRRV